MIIYIFLLSFLLNIQMSRSLSLFTKNPVVFENGQPGYLRSVGANGYVGWSTHTSSFENLQDSPLAVTAAPTNAVQLRVFRRPHNSTPYNIFVVEKTSKGALPRVLTLSSQEDRTDILALPQEEGYNSYFSLSPVVDGKKNASQIYIRGRCLSVSSKGMLTVASCVDLESPAKNNQLFRWVTVDKFKKEHSKASRAGKKKPSTIAPKPKPVAYPNLPAQPQKRPRYANPPAQPQKRPRYANPPVQPIPQSHPNTNPIYSPVQPLQPVSNYPAYPNTNQNISPLQA